MRLATLSLRRRHTGRPAAQRGVSLVELMIALVLGLLVAGGVYRVYLGNQQSYRLQESLARVQENGRFAVQLLARDLRQAAYQGGCRAGALRNHIIDPDDPDTDADKITLYDIGAGVRGWEGQGGTFEDDLNGYVDGSDVLLIKHAAENTDLKIDSTNGTQIKLRGDGSLLKGSIAVVADPDACDIFQTNSSDESTNIVLNDAKQEPGNNNRQQFSKAFGPDAALLHYSSTVFYIGAGVGGGSALRERRYTSDTPQDEELISGVVDMQLRYGVDTDDDQRVDVYRAADHGDIAADWGNVLAVRVSLLLRAEQDNVLPDPTTLAFDGGTFTAAAGDRRLYQVFTTTTGIRNRLP